MVLKLPQGHEVYEYVRWRIYRGGAIGPWPPTVPVVEEKIFVIFLLLTLKMVPKWS